MTFNLRKTSFSALNPICYSLIPQLFTPGLFPGLPLFSLHLMDTCGSEEMLRGLKMETEDLALPQLHEVTVHSDQTQAFQEAHFIIFLDDLQPICESNDEPDDKDHMVSRVAECFCCYGQLIEANARKDVRVIVAGDSFINLKCSLLIENAPSVDPHNFVAMTTQLECEARAQLAQKLSVKTAGKIINICSNVCNTMMHLKFDSVQFDYFKMIYNYFRKYSEETICIFFTFTST